MESNTQFADDRAVSPVVGVALLIAIAVILAAVIGAVVLGLGSTGADTPQAQITFDDTTGELVHDGGDPLKVSTIELRYDGGTANLSSDLKAGQREDISSFAGGTDEVSIVWIDPDGGSETVVATVDTSGY